MIEHQRHHNSGRNRHREPGHEARRGGRHGRSGPPFTLRDLFGRGQFGPGVRRGEIRPLILAVLAQKPMHGYEVIQALEAESGGRWRPSAGSVYPTLQQLADEGLVTSEDIDGRRTYTLTDEGRAAAADAAPRTPWADAADDAEPSIRQLAMQLAGAVMQVDRMGSQRAREEARRILTDTRRRMYRLLAEDDDQDDPAAGTSSGEDAGPA
jgi:DNA-binding PadR family transcriptional regulator